MVGEIFASLGAIKNAYDIAKGLKDIDDAVRRNAAVIELQERIVDAQQEQVGLIEKASELEREVARLHAWDEDKKRYKLTEVQPGCVTYTLKEGMENGEPPHHLCANCYNDSIKSLMQTEIRFPGRCSVMVCHRCGSELYIAGGREPVHEGMRRKPGPRRR